MPGQTLMCLLRLWVRLYLAGFISSSRLLWPSLTTFLSSDPTGAAGKFGPYLLAAQKGGFESGMHDVFSVSTPEIGQVVELALSHNDKGFGASWQIDRAELENMNTGETNDPVSFLPDLIYLSNYSSQGRSTSLISRSGLTRPVGSALCAAPLATMARAPPSPTIALRSQLAPMMTAAWRMGRSLSTSRETGGRQVMFVVLIIKG